MLRTYRELTPKFPDMLWKNCNFDINSVKILLHTLNVRGFLCFWKFKIFSFVMIYRVQKFLQLENFKFIVVQHGIAAWASRHSFIKTMLVNVFLYIFWPEGYWKFCIKGWVPNPHQITQAGLSWGNSSILLWHLNPMSNFFIYKWGVLISHRVTRIVSIFLT